MKKLIFIAACICAFMYIFILKHQSSSTEENVETTETVETEVNETLLEKEDTNVNGNHLTFKGVPIDGTLKNFVRRMEKAGFYHDGDKGGAAMLTGDFAGYKGCTVIVSTLDQKDLVSNITVWFPPRETWGDLSGDYFSLKKLLTKKYGKPSASQEKFQNDFLDDDGSRMRHVTFDECKYKSTFKTPKGTIILSIAHQGSNACYVEFRYFDKINSGIITNEALKDL